MGLRGDARIAPQSQLIAHEFSVSFIQRVGIGFLKTHMAYRSSRFNAACRTRAWSATALAASPSTVVPVILLGVPYSVRHPQFPLRLVPHQHRVAQSLAVKMGMVLCIADSPHAAIAIQPGRTQKCFYVVQGRLAHVHAASPQDSAQSSGWAMVLNMVLASCRESSRVCWTTMG